MNPRHKLDLTAHMLHSSFWSLKTIPFRSELSSFALAIASFLSIAIICLIFIVPSLRRIRSYLGVIGNTELNLLSTLYRFMQSPKRGIGHRSELPKWGMWSFLITETMNKYYLCIVHFMMLQDAKNLWIIRLLPHNTSSKMQWRHTLKQSIGFVEQNLICLMITARLAVKWIIWNSNCYGLDIAFIEIQRIYFWTFTHKRVNSRDAPYLLGVDKPYSHFKTKSLIIKKQD